MQNLKLKNLKLKTVSVVETCKIMLVFMGFAPGPQQGDLQRFPKTPSLEGSPSCLLINLFICLYHGTLCHTGLPEKTQDMSLLV